MSEFRRSIEDDDNDTVLFDRLQEHVLRTCPNPRRIGCPSRGILEAFVDEPGSVSLDELNELHILHCAECTRDLMELRHIRETKRSLSLVPEMGEKRFRVRYGLFAAAACLLVVAGILLLMRHGFTGEALNHDAQIASVKVDLSGQGPSRGIPNVDPSQPQIFLPRKRVQLHLILPYFSASGQYTVGVTSTRTLEHPLASANGSAISSGANTEFQVLLDLSHIPPGKYYLSTLPTAGDSGPSFYAMTLD